jgi:hypothetical protein
MHHPRAILVISCGLCALPALGCNSGGSGFTVPGDATVHVFPDDSPPLVLAIGSTRASAGPCVVGAQTVPV